MSPYAKLDCGALRLCLQCTTLSSSAQAWRTGLATPDAAELGLDLPQRAARLLGPIERGEIEFNVNHEGLHEFNQQLQRLANRLALIILPAATIVAFGLVMTITHPPRSDVYGGWLFSILFLGSLSFGPWLMGAIWRAGRS